MVSAPVAASRFPRPALLLLGTLLAANLLIWAAALVAFAGRPVLLGAALLAWGFGLRHALDADHIAAIDNVCRRAASRARPPWLIGTGFALGHSAVVMLAGAVVASGAPLLHERFSTLAAWGAPLGNAVSAGFLLLVGVANLLSLIGLLRVGPADQPIPPRGVLSRLLDPLLRRVSGARGMFLVGLVFGLGFDTASEIGLLSLSAASSTRLGAGPSVLLLPLLFTVGMTAIDSADGVMMLRAYRGLGIRRGGRPMLPLLLAAASVLLALVVGLGEAAGIDTGDERLGAVATAVFVLAIGVAALRSRLGTGRTAATT